VLLAIAGGHAADRGALRGLLGEAETTWQERGATPEGFFTRTGTSGAAEDYLALLGSWATTVSRGLPQAARFLLHMLACMEPGDRLGFVLEENWTRLWRELGGADPVPDRQEALTELTDSGLAGLAPQLTDLGHLHILLHPAIAAAARGEMGGQPSRGS
jgi:hypothetical protein